MDNETTQQLIKMARQLLTMCDGDVNSISIHADTLDGLPYMHLCAYGPDRDEAVYSWYEFLEDE